MVDFNYMYKTHYNYIRAIVSRLIQEDANDITQRAFYKLSVCTYAHNEVVARDFLKKTAIRMSLDHIRSRRRYRNAINGMKNELDLGKEPSTEQETKEFEQAVELAEIQAQVLDFIYKEIENLPSTCRQVFELFYKEQLNTSQISERLGIKRNTVQSHLHRARVLLRMEILFQRKTVQFLARLPLFKTAAKH